MKGSIAHSSFIGMTTEEIMNEEAYKTHRLLGET